MASDFGSYEDRAAEKLASAFTQTLKSKASTSGWPKDIVKELSVVYEGRLIRVDYPDELEETIDKLEYGNFDHPAMAVIRPLQTGVDEAAYNAFQDAICDFLFDNEVFA